jgi:hypothetical protein
MTTCATLIVLRASTLLLDQSHPLAALGTAVQQGHPLGAAASLRHSAPARVADPAEKRPRLWELFFKGATQKSARVVVGGTEIELQPHEPIFEKCSHLREEGGGADRNLVYSE